MVEAPEKIFLTPAEGTRLQPGTTQQRDPWWDFDGAAWTTGPEKDIDVEYVRADIAASQLAEARAKIDVQRERKEYAQRSCEAAEADRDRLAADNARLRDGFAEPDVMAMSNGVISLHYEDLEAAQSAFDWLEARAMGEKK